MEQSITYTHNKAPSQLAQIVQFSLGVFKTKGLIERQLKKQTTEQKATKIPKAFHKKFSVTTRLIKNRNTISIKPKEQASDHVILYFHGGAYIFNISNLNWKLAEELAHHTHATIVVANYPLLPTHTHTDAYQYAEALYTEILRQTKPQNIILLGDSAGGGLALGLAQKLKHLNKPQPAQIILLSPWLDISMTNPDIHQTDRKDKVLGIKGLKLVGEAYAGNTSATDFKLSPIYGNSKGLGQISIFIGTNELFIADARKMKQQLEHQHIPIHYFEYPKLFHDWIIIPNLPESKLAIQQIASLIAS